MNDDIIDKIKNILKFKQSELLPNNFFYQVLHIPFNLKNIEHAIHPRAMILVLIEKNRNEVNKIFDNMIKDIKEKI